MHSAVVGISGAVRKARLGRFLLVGHGLHVGDGLLVGVCAIAPVVDLFVHRHAHGTALDAVAVLLALVSAAILVWRRRIPATAALLSGACGLAILGAGYRMPVTMLAPIIALGAVGAAGNHVRSALVAVLAAVSAVALGHWLDPVPVLSTDSLSHAALAVAPVLVGELVGTWRGTVSLRLERAELRLRAERDAERLRAEQERRRIARDLHDVVGHALTTINVQAGVAAHLLDSRPEFARDALREITVASGQALRDVRSLVGVLREPDGDGAPGDPEAGLADLPLLVDRARRMGVEATLTLRGTSGDGVPELADRVPMSVQVTAYRIVQESLTNVRKHAGEVPASVEIDVDAREVRVRVWNAPGRRAPRPAAGTAGSGVAGMRERAAILGGQLRSGPDPEGGFQVTAFLPIAADGREET